MSSYQSHNGLGGGGSGGGKSRTKVKPILRKLTASEKNSLDLDRPIAEQEDGLGIYDYSTTTGPRHDMVTGRRGYHNRSTSVTSQFSTGSGHGGNYSAGSFIHPFQQQPQNRPYTPPVASSYTNSLREIDGIDGTNNHSPALTEDEDHLQFRQHNSNLNLNLRSASNLSTRAPSITGQSASPVASHPLSPLRIQTKNNSSSRLALAASHTSLHNFSELGSPTDTMTPSSTIRTSMEKGFRIRSRSEVDSRPRAETIQEARRKFQEKEQAKEEKAALADVRALEKKQYKEAKEIERQHRRSSASEATRSKRSKSDLTTHEKAEGLFGRDYNSASYQTPPLAAEDVFITTARSNTAKLKTHSAWTKFVMWLRTRFLRMKKKSS